MQDSPRLTSPANRLRSNLGTSAQRSIRRPFMESLGPVRANRSAEGRAKAFALPVKGGRRQVLEEQATPKCEMSTSKAARYRDLDKRAWFSTNSKGYGASARATGCGLGLLGRPKKSPFPVTSKMSPPSIPYEGVSLLPCNRRRCPNCPWKLRRERSTNDDEAFSEIDSANLPSSPRFAKPGGSPTAVSRFRTSPSQDKMLGNPMG